MHWGTVKSSLGGPRRLALCMVSAAIGIAALSARPLRAALPRGHEHLRAAPGRLEGLPPADQARRGTSGDQLPPGTSERHFLPIAYVNPVCRQLFETVDVVLVMDRSTSMSQAIDPGGQTKTGAALAAAHGFVELLHLAPDAAGRRDQVAIVGFNDTAWTEQALTSDKRAVYAAFTRIALKAHEGTRLDLAFAGGEEALEGPAHRPENRRLMIMLTDGLPNRVPFGPGSPYPGSQRQEDSVIAAAAAAKARGTRIYTIGLGVEPDIMPWLLQACASTPAMYLHAPWPEDLSAIYARIATSRTDCLPRPTAWPPTPRPTATTVPSTTPSPTPLPTNTPTPTPCPARQSNADVSLVLDMSTSMQRQTRDGGTKYAAAVAGARDFVRLMRLAPDAGGFHDQVAVSGFNGDSWTTQGLTNELAAADAALDAQPRRLDRGTRLDLAFRQGQAALDAGPRGPGNRPVVIMLTDGMPNGVPEGPGGTQNETVLAEADKVKQAGTLVFTIGLGLPSDTDPDLLTAAATDPSMYYYAPDGADLAAIYKQIAGRIVGCP